MNFPGFTAERSLQRSHRPFNLPGANFASGQSDQVEPAYLLCITTCLYACYRAGGDGPACADTCAYTCRKYGGLAVQPEF